MHKTKTPEEQLYLLGSVFLAAGVIGIFIYFQIIIPNFKLPPCMFYALLGIYCPGCGGTRAIQALLEGDFLHSLWYHPLVLYTLVIFGGFMLTQTFERLHIRGIKGWKFHNWHLYGAVVVILLNWILKNVLLLFFNYRL